MKLEIFNNIFKNTTNSYKYYWWLSIIEIHVLRDDSKIYFEEIVLKIISKIWYPVNYFKLSFGKSDQCQKYIKQIKKKYKLEDNISETDLYEFLIEHKNSDLLIKLTNDLTKYVPYRFIRPWYSEQTRNLKDGIVNSKIVQLQSNSAPYSVDIFSKKIVISPAWSVWIKINYNLIKANAYLELIKYLEKENPNTPSLSKKLEKPNNRNLSSHTKIWKRFIQNKPTQISVFENKPLIELDELSMDHFFPWSFMTHDLIWNLHPANKSINSSKNNILPNKYYFSAFYTLQFNFCKFLLNQDMNKPLENYYSLFNCSKDDLSTLSHELFVNKMNNFYLPQYEIAVNMGFESNWSLS